MTELQMADLPAALDVMVLERGQEGSLRRIGAIPDGLRRRYLLAG